MKPERRLQLDLSAWIKMQYPDVIFNVDTSGDFKTIQSALLNKRMRSSSKMPDLFISEARGGYFGLYIELKTGSVLNKKGQYKNEHLEKQAEMLDALNERGYMACFGVGFEATANIIKMYMQQNRTEVKP